MISPSPNLTYGQMLFDVMTHTTSGYVTFLHQSIIQLFNANLRNSGIGDFGLDGIDRLIKEHCCNRQCHGLGLDPLQTVTPSQHRRSSQGHTVLAEGSPRLDSISDSSDEDDG